MDGSTAIDLHHEDCVKGLRRLAPESVDVAVTSPPYNLGIRYSHFRDDAARADYLDWSLRWAMELDRVLKPLGALFLNIGAVPANPLLPHQIALRLSEVFVLQNTIHWIKSIAIERRNGESLAVGHFKPLNSPRYLSDCHEYIFHFTKQGDAPLQRLAIGVPYADKTNIARWNHTGGRDRRCRGNNWFIPYRTIRSRATDRPHPATFPPELAAMCLRLHGVNDRSVVLDPFLGLGNSAIAAQECGAAQFIGFEIDEGYLAEAQARITESSRKLPKLADVSA
jgi:site-specific DNA-methyltransferase (adenine-specific)